MKRLIPLLVLVLAVPTLGAETIRKSGAMSPGGVLDVVNVAGRVVIRGWDKAEIEVEATFEDDVEGIEFDADGERTTVRVLVTESRRRGRGGDIEARLLIRAPASSRLSVNTVSADVEVADMTGRQRLESVSGDIDTESRGEEVSVLTISGDVDIDGKGATSTLDLSLVSGDAMITNIGGSLDARTVSGDLEIRAGTLSRARISTTSGDVGLTTRLAGNGRLDMEGVSGDLRLALCGERDAEFNLSTFSGDIEDYEGDREPDRSRYGPGAELRFTVGSGSGQISMNTMSGSIELEDC